MGKANAAWTQKMLDVLADGQWHERTHLQSLAMAVVPPGQAHRRAEKARLAMISDESQPRQKGDEITSILSGAKSIVNDSICNLLKYGKAEQKNEEGVRFIRLLTTGEARPIHREKQNRSKPTTQTQESKPKPKGPDLVKIGTDVAGLHQVRCDVCQESDFVEGEWEGWMALAEHIKKAHPVTWRAVSLALSGQARAKIQQSVVDRKAVS